MKLSVLDNERFTCNSCTNCCRIWQVELLPGEAERVSSLEWPKENPLHSIEVLNRRGAKTYLAHRADGACVFLNESNGRCQIHERFGATVKPLGCQLYPYQIMPTFNGEATVIARYDCPTVRKNQGATHEQALPEIRRYADQIELGSYFNDQVRNHLAREQIEIVVEFAMTMLNGFAGDDQRAMFLAFLCDWVAELNTDELDREALGGAFVVLKELVETASRTKMKRPGMLARMSFRTLLSLYLRRDEDVVDGRASRLGRAIGMVKTVMGFGSFRSLGLIHPRGKVRRARLFKSGIDTENPETFALLWRLVRNRLESFQFMGQGNLGLDFLSGLRSLAMLYPLVKATAKYSAGSRGSSVIQASDVDYACNVIEHSFGRLGVLKQNFVGKIERVLREPMMFARVVKTV